MNVYNAITSRWSEIVPLQFCHHTSPTAHSRDCRQSNDNVAHNSKPKSTNKSTKTVRQRCNQYQTPLVNYLKINDPANIWTKQEGIIYSSCTDPFLPNAPRDARQHSSQNHATTPYPLECFHKPNLKKPNYIEGQTQFPKIPEHLPTESAQKVVGAISIAFYTSRAASLLYQLISPLPKHTRVFTFLVWIGNSRRIHYEHVLPMLT